MGTDTIFRVDQVKNNQPVPQSCPDMTMPNLTGVNLAVEIKKYRLDIPIILCTGFSKRINPEIAEEIGINSILMKPVTLDDMARTVRSVLDNKNSIFD